jgi:hypothetical protein
VSVPALKSHTPGVSSWVPVIVAAEAMAMFSNNRAKTVNVEANLKPFFISTCNKKVLLD